MNWSDFWDEVSTCPTCSALVHDSHLSEHQAWHSAEAEVEPPSNHILETTLTITLPGHIQNPGTVYNRVQTVCNCGWRSRHHPSARMALIAFDGHRASYEKVPG